MALDSSEITLIKALASKYIWWKTPDEAASLPDRVIAQVMELGDYADVQLLANKLGEARLRQTILKAEAGQFSERSWIYWHYRLGLRAAREQPPPLPVRSLL